MVTPQLRELLLQSLTHERGGVLIYRTALECVRNADLRKEWTHYLAQTEKHVSVLTRACEAIGIDAGEMTPGCMVVQHTGKALVVAMKMALASEDRAAAELVACECVVLAETKDHFDWELIGQCAKALDGAAADALREAYDAIEDEEDEHLYHTKGWCRELWLKALGLPAELPPPEEKRDVKSAMDAAVVEKARKRR
jgi:hypothetical protein